MSDPDINGDDLRMTVGRPSSACVGSCDFPFGQLELAVSLWLSRRSLLRAAPSVMVTVLLALAARRTTFGSICRSNGEVDGGARHVFTMEVVGEKDAESTRSPLTARWTFLTCQLSPSPASSRRRLVGSSVSR